MLRYLVNLVFTLSKTSYTSSGWYRKYSDGWIEQGIIVTNSGLRATYSKQTKTTNFLTAFSSAIWGSIVDFVITDTSYGYKRTGRLSFINSYASSESKYVSEGQYSLSNSGVTLTYYRPTSYSTDGAAPIDGVQVYFVVWGK